MRHKSALLSIAIALLALPVVLSGVRFGDLLGQGGGGGGGGGGRVGLPAWDPLVSVIVDPVEDGWRMVRPGEKNVVLQRLRVASLAARKDPLTELRLDSLRFLLTVPSGAKVADLFENVRLMADADGDGVFEDTGWHPTQDREKNGELVLITSPRAADLFPTDGSYATLEVRADLRVQRPVTNRFSVRFAYPQTAKRPFITVSMRRPVLRTLSTVRKDGEPCAFDQGCDIAFTTSETLRMIAPPACGDGLLDAGEQCDDGNTADGDGCSGLCRVETPEVSCPEASMCTAMKISGQCQDLPIDCPHGDVPQCSGACSQDGCSGQCCRCVPYLTGPPPGPPGDTLQNGLIVRMKLDEPKAVDIVRNSADPTGETDGQRPNGSVPSTDTAPGSPPDSRSRYFKLPQDAVRIPGHPKLDVGQFTVAFWLKTADKPRTYQGFLGRTDDGNRWNKGFGFYADTEKDDWKMKFFVGNWANSAAGSAEFRAWTHYAGTYDGQTMRLFISGKEVSAVAYAGPVEWDGVPLILGYLSTQRYGARPMNIDEMRLYNRPLSAAEVASLAAGVGGSRIGNLFITPSPMSSRQLLGGALGDAVLSLDMRAENESVDVTKLVFEVGGVNRDIMRGIDRLELYKRGQPQPFASATVAQCGSLLPVSEFTLCAVMPNKELIIDPLSGTTVVVRPRMRSDVDGAISVSGGADIAFVLKGGGQSVDARGLTSQSNLSSNNGDGNAVGEVFVRNHAGIGPDEHIFGPNNTIVLSKIVSIVNANPDPDGSPVPPIGRSRIGQFKFSAAANLNTKNGLNKSELTDIAFNVTATNVAIDAGSFRFNRDDKKAVTHDCAAYWTYDSVAPITGTATHSFVVRCEKPMQSGVNTVIDQGSEATFVLEMNITNPQIQNASSALQVSLQNFSDPTPSSFGGSSTDSHLRWLDRDALSAVPFLWVEHPETVVKSTSYLR